MKRKEKDLSFSFFRKILTIFRNFLGDTPPNPIQLR